MTATSLTTGLLTQARLLVEPDPRKPEDANLRQAVSAAYYALFHLLTDAAVRQMTSSQRRHLALRQLLARAFTRGDMSRVSKQSTVSAAGRASRRDWADKAGRRAR